MSMCVSLSLDLTNSELTITEILESLNFVLKISSEGLSTNLQGCIVGEEVTYLVIEIFFLND